MTFQLSSTLLDACVLAVVKKSDTYGYEITRDIRQIVPISDSTLYPVLRRLEKYSLLETYDKPYQGRNRRYYTITKEGRLMLDFYYKEWEIYKSKIDIMLKGGINE